MGFKVLEGSRMSEKLGEVPTCTVGIPNICKFTKGFNKLLE